MSEAEPEPVPTSRATMIRAEPFGDAGRGGGLARRRCAATPTAADAEVDDALAVLNRALHAHRAARGGPHARDVRPQAGAGGAHRLRHRRRRWPTAASTEAWELPARAAQARRRSMEAPEERFAALLGGRESVLACEELLLRARADLDAGRPREAALQARVALESLLAEMPDMPGDRRPALEADREPVGRAANAALAGEPRPASLAQAVERGSGADGVRAARPPRLGGGTNASRDLHRRLRSAA